jgi:hypothetical protein
MPTIEVNGSLLEYHETGSGAPLVLVHGSVNDHRTWGAQVPFFSSRYRVVSFSRRYHHPNPWAGDGSDYSVSLHADDLVGLIRALSPGPCSCSTASAPSRSSVGYRIVWHRFFRSLKRRRYREPRTRAFRESRRVQRHGHGLPGEPQLRHRRVGGTCRSRSRPDRCLVRSIGPLLDREPDACAGLDLGATFPTSCGVAHSWLDECRWRIPIE